MRLKLLRDARITAKAGEIVEVSPAAARILLDAHMAEPAPAVGAAAAEPEKAEPKARTGRKKKEQ